MKKVLGIVGVLLILLFFGTVFYLSVNTPAQPTRGEQIDSIGLRELHLLVSDPADVTDICKDIPDGKVSIRWVDGKDVVQQSMIPCSKIKTDANLASGQVKFVFDKEWSNGVPGWYLDCGDGIVTYLELPPHGELGMGCELMEVLGNNYSAEALSDPDNFLDGPWLTEALISVSE